MGLQREAFALGRAEPGIARGKAWKLPGFGLMFVGKSAMPQNLFGGSPRSRGPR